MYKLSVRGGLILLIEKVEYLTVIENNLLNK